MTSIDITKVSNLFTLDEIKQYEDILFYKDDKLNYYLFDAYKIEHDHDGYNVYKYDNLINHKFSELKYALCYCISSRKNKIYIMQDIIDYDFKLGSLDFDIKNQRKLLNSNEYMYSIKLHESILKRKMVYNKLKNIVDDCHLWQSAKFGRILNLSVQR